MGRRRHTSVLLVRSRSRRTRGAWQLQQVPQRRVQVRFLIISYNIIFPKDKR